MIGCYDFGGHYEWTFDWLDREGGHPFVRDYWDQAINRDSQIHARELILRDGFAGMEKYWGHTLTEESPSLGFTITATADVYRTDMHDCPSKGFLIRNSLAQYRDHSDHCMGWVGPPMREAGICHRPRQPLRPVLVGDSQGRQSRGPVGAGIASKRQRCSVRSELAAAGIGARSLPPRERSRCEVARFVPNTEDLVR